MDKNIDLLTRLQEGENTEDQLVKQNMGLVMTIAKRFSYSGVEFEDLIQIGTIGLLKSIRNFETERGLQFSTYAVPVIMGEIKKYIRDNGPIKVSRGIREQYCIIHKATEKFKSENLRSPTVNELQEITGISAEEIVFVSDAGCHPLSIDDPLSEGSTRTVADTVADPDDGSGRLDSFALRQCLNLLPTTDRRLIYLRYYMNKTQQETADMLGMTQVQVSRREKKIMLILREKMIS